ncbi:hypothetical protein AGDE_00776 [Angomonas deanei]|uniref:B30.2/SPRY domain-containing protein n=1 Tax=Angomonas deanei TaxID=59799 RepID=S9VHP1_9TRYP|nr:hypothetical protein AGDE_10610 [Angomonas deanei]EPY38288.1 hypothetical protein AGDE_05641 [Angomonas deanei]EPY40379.1 hypothetical protein AGDE_03549 [Angomonas deanei]EPY43146.1 hypothetical protein AGDE_00776 [Angomonas deanei]CAD2216364.1 hypothetical protein, conserved [Angomonas deanei]|eukprot:EPY27982.1 hypothetical protein AGDE_10610 [Angomonas deanei]
MGLEVFEMDTQCPHPGVSLYDTVAQRETNGGWVTVRSKSPLTEDNHQWAVHIVDQGEGTDGSGLMVGMLPELSSSALNGMGSRYISELGGWCISRAGDTYGSWRCERVEFSSGCVLEFDWDAQSGTLYIVCGRRKVTAHIPSLSPKDLLYPAVSMYYLNQKVVFV